MLSQYGDSQSWIDSYPPDIYFDSSYHDLHTQKSVEEPWYASFSEGEKFILIPGMKRKINNEHFSFAEDHYFDIQTCNGYGGPISNTEGDANFIEAAWEEWRKVCKKQKIVTAFFRLHPILQNERYLPRDATVVVDRKTVYLDLEMGSEALWNAANSQHRNMVNKARREGAHVEWSSEAWDEFEALYNRSMERTQAPSALRFSHEYFMKLRSLPGAQLAFYRHQGRLVCGSIFLFSTRYCHYHLSAREVGACNYASNLLLQDALEKAIEQGLKGFHLGGGRTSDPKDNLLAFKKSLGGLLLDFKVARVIADKTALDAIEKKWQKVTSQEKRWLLFYRQPMAPSIQT